MRERAVLLRKDPALLGVITETPAGIPTGQVGCIMLNAGVVHRVGPNRLYVRLSRALAAAGFPVLRFDLSGLGDSETRRDSLSFTESAPIEAREAMDYMARATGVEHFVLAGLCSGAGTAFQVAQLDPRVVGAVLIDPYAFPTLKFRFLYYLRRMGRWRSWRDTFLQSNGLGQRVLAVFGWQPSVQADEDDAALVTPDSAGEIPSRDAVAASLRQVLDRGVRLCLVFSGVPSTYNYRRQFEDAFPDVPLKNVQVEFFKDADHSFSHRAAQIRLADTLCRWAGASFQSQPSATAPALGDSTVASSR